MRTRSLCAHVALCLIALSGSVVAQSSDPGNNSGSPSGFGTAGGNALPAAIPGGAAMADFDTLMNLIQQTVDPEDWLAAGGQSTILPYPSGVYVDPKGHIKRLKPTELSEQIWEASSKSQPWTDDSNLRVVSLKGLDQALYRAAVRSEGMSAELLNLAGLSRIQYVKVDAGNEDILLAGPAGAPAFGFQLDDVALVAALINGNTLPMGCSIEPANEGIRNAQSLLTKPNTPKLLQKDPARVASMLQDAIGAHSVKVFGMRSNTATAVALVDADEQMKKVGFGTAVTRPRVKSYFDYLDDQGAVQNQSLIRWWFSYSAKQVAANKQKNLFELPDEAIAVLSEQQWVSQNGRAPTGQQDQAADAFAAGFSKEIPRLRKTNASYARLCAVFESALALQLALEATGQPDLQAWLPNLCSLGLVQPRDAQPPQTVDGLTAWHRLNNGTVVAVVSGGVKIDVAMVAPQEKWTESRFLSASMVPPPPKTTTENRWWWD